jgi:hypothetical protein
MKIFHMRRGRLNLPIMVSHVRVQSAKKSNELKGDRQIGLEILLDISANFFVAYYTGNSVSWRDYDEN